MPSKSLRGVLVFVVCAGLLAWGTFAASTQSRPRIDKTGRHITAAALLIGPVFTQPVDPSGQLYQSSWLDPDGSDFDRYVWDDFTLQSDQAIAEIDWFGGYDPARLGGGGPALDFSVSIYPSIPAGTEPAVANPPLVKYQTGGSAGETSIGMVGGIGMYAYSFSLPTPFTASAGVKYWVQIIASQGGSIPDWGLAAGTGGDSSHFRWGSGAGGDSGFRTVPGDAAFTLLGPIPETSTNSPTNTTTDTPTDTATPTSSNTPTATNTPSNTPTNTPTYTPTASNTPTNTATNTPTQTPTASNTPTNTPTNTSTATPTNTPTRAPTNTPTSTPVANTLGKVTGGGNVNSPGGKLTFGFVVRYSNGARTPSGNLTFKDHGSNISLKATSFGSLNISGNQAVITGYGTVNGGSNVAFTVLVVDRGAPGSSDTFMIQIPAWNGYSGGGSLSGGNIRISTP